MTAKPLDLLTPATPLQARLLSASNVPRGKQQKGECNEALTQLDSIAKEPRQSKNNFNAKR